MAAEELFKDIKIVHMQPVVVELNKTTKGYTWNIKVYASTVDEALKLIEDVDRRLRQEFSDTYVPKKNDWKRSDIEENVLP